MESIIRNVKDLAADERRVYETVLRRELEDSQQVFVMVVSEPADPTSGQRARAWQALQELSKKAEQHMQQAGVSGAQWEAAVDDACEQVRYGKPS